MSTLMKNLRPAEPEELYGSTQVWVRIPLIGTRLTRDSDATFLPGRMGGYSTGLVTEPYRVIVSKPYLEPVPGQESRWTYFEEVMENVQLEDIWIGDTPELVHLPDDYVPVPGDRLWLESNQSVSRVEIRAIHSPRLRSDDGEFKFVLEYSVSFEGEDGLFHGNQSYPRECLRVEDGFRPTHSIEKKTILEKSGIVKVGRVVSPLHPYHQMVQPTGPVREPVEGVVVKVDGGTLWVVYEEGQTRAGRPIFRTYPYPRIYWQLLTIPEV